MKRITTTQLRRKPRDGERIVMVTCYDATFARLVDEANVDVILIGDSLGMVVQGHENTLPVTLDEMIYHCRAVARGAQRAHLVGDLPFGSYQAGTEQLIQSAARLLKERKSRHLHSAFLLSQETQHRCQLPHVPGRC
jgi:3-methyl-2-oxobutanoate hydroxymethyltransferase